MGTITTGIGLVSGLNTADIINQLMAIEQKPVNDLQTRIATANTQKTAYTDLQTQLAGLLINSQLLAKPSTFTSAAATSSDPNSITATTTGAATPGSYQFQVARLVTTQQAITNGFANYMSTPVGAGTLTIEEGGGDLSSSTPLSQLNGGNGVSRGQFRITDASGHSDLIDISAAVTLDDVVKKINTAVNVSVHASISGDGLVISDNSGGTGNLAIQDVGSTHSATDLGLASSSASGTITGSAINFLGNSTLLSQLNDGRGVRISGSPDFRVTFSDSSTLDVNLNGAKTIGDVINTINTAGGSKLKASLGSDGHSLQLTDTSGLGGAFTVTSLNGSDAAADLGLTGSGTGSLNGSWVLSSLNTVLLSSLNGGSGLATGAFTITNRAGTATHVDLSSAKTAQDVIDAINKAGAGVTASLKNSGNGIQLTDTSGGTGSLTIADDAGSSVASSLGIAGTFSSSSVQGADLQRQWVTENTLLSSYNGGKGVNKGKFTITNAKGSSYDFDLSSGSVQSMGDLIRFINARGAGVTASINAHGDGLLLTDTSGGAGKLSVSDTSGTAAADLNIAGTASTASPTVIDGSMEKSITITATDTLSDVQTKINNLGWGVSAQIINDGTGANPYRLSLTSKNTGAAGRFVFDAGSTSLAANNLVDAQDAAVFLGGGAGSSAQPLLVTSSSNQISGIVSGVNLQLTGVSSSPVTINVTRTSDAATTQLNTFVTGFNTLVDKINTDIAYNSTTNTGGPLLGDSTVQDLQYKLYTALNSFVPQGGHYRTLADIGLTIGDGAKLSFDQNKFEAAFATDPNSVQQLFTAMSTTTDTTGKSTSKGVGFGYVLQNAINGAIDPVNGTLIRENSTIDTQIQGYQDRITQLNALLDQKRLRLATQFANMESALASLQSQQMALNSLSGVSSSSSSTTKKSG